MTAGAGAAMRCTALLGPGGADGPDEQHPQQHDKETHEMKTPSERGTARIIGDRGLGPDERNAVWRDREGDRWRYDFKAGAWQYKANQPSIASTWLTTRVGGGEFTSPLYAPYREVGPNVNAPKPTNPTSGELFAEILKAAAAGKWLVAVGALDAWADAVIAELKAQT